jgi:hypothetical protein
MIECHTLCYGNNWWIDECLPTIINWCSRHQYKLKIWTDKDVAELQEKKFIATSIWGKFIESDNDWCIWVDSDVWIQSEAPKLTSEMQRGFWLATDPSSTAWAPLWRKWCFDHKLMPAPRENWIYRNAGVWAIDKSTAKKLNAIAVPPMYPGVQEQHHLNYWASQLPESMVHVLPHQWNAMVPRSKSLIGWQGGWFVHLLSDKKNKWDEMDRFGGIHKFSHHNN